MSSWLGLPGGALPKRARSTHGRRGPRAGRAATWPMGLGALLLMVGCGDGGEAPWPPGPSPYPKDDLLRVNHVQAKGTHNSYHVEPDRPVDDSHRYTQPSLTAQLADHGVRQVELDLHYREDVGFEVFHLPIMDEESTCPRLVDCLGELKAWSDENPWHLPIVVWFEPKDDADLLDPTLLELAGRFGELEDVIQGVIPRRRILTPDDVRGDHPDLPTALATDGWPTLGAARGRFLFALLDSGEHRARYLEGAPNLAGRLLFVDSDAPTDPFAATFKQGVSLGEEAAVRALVEAGFLVVSNVDSADASPLDNAARRDAALAAGVHYSSSDFPAAGTAGDYWLTLPGGAPARCNPVSAPVGCTAADIEALP